MTGGFVSGNHFTVESAQGPRGQSPVPGGEGGHGQPTTPFHLSSASLNARCRQSTQGQCHHQNPKGGLALRSRAWWWPCGSSCPCAWSFQRHDMLLQAGER